MQPLARRRLQRVVAALAAISTVDMGVIVVEHLIGQARQERYDPALRLCALVLGGRIIAATDVGLSGASVLFPMPQVWEDFVAEWVRLRHPGATIKAPHSFPILNHGSTLVATADIVVVDDNDRPIALYDAKYKAVTTYPAAEDVYQMVTYCQRLALNEASLVYPGRGETTQGAVGDIRLNTIRLTAASMAVA